MSSKNKRIVAVVLMIVLIVLAIPALNVAQYPLRPDANGEVVVYADLKTISNHGNVPLKNDSWFLQLAMKRAGIEIGDTAQVRFLDKVMQLPVVENYSEVRAEENLIRLHMNKMEISTNLGDFASTYFADEITKDDGSYTWVYKEGVEGPVAFHISLCEKGGAKTVSGFSYTDMRSDYPNLTDEQFANFRMVRTTGIGEGTLYRTCSPVDPGRSRNTYADAAIRNAGVRTIVNLADTREIVEAFPGYADSYYSSTDYIGLNMGISPKTEDFKIKLAQGLRFFAEHEGPYAFHCLEGKDRTGIVAALLECYMGASLEEVESDYMVTFYNYFGVEPGSELYEDLVNNNIVSMLRSLLDTKDLEKADLSKLAESYFRSIGMTDTELADLRANLSKSWAETGAAPEAAPETPEALPAAA